MEHIAPLLQTILWVGLVAGVLFRFHKPLHALISALAKRIESGSTLKAGPFEIADQIRPQTTAEQAIRIAEEVKALPAAAMSTGTIEQSKPPPGLADVALEFARVEDLALRTIQAEVGETITRNVKIGELLHVDGLYWKDGRLTLIEVKYLPNDLHVKKFALDAAAHFQESVTKEQKLAKLWPNLLIVLVYKNTGDLAAHRQEIETMSSLAILPTTVRQLTVADLSAQIVRKASTDA